jgi:cation transport ATPase
MNEMSGTQTTAQTARISTFLLLVVFLTLALSFVALIFGATVVEQDTEASWVLLLLGFLGVALSTYVLFQTRRRLSKLKIVIPPVVTTIECKKCGFKNVREFQRGDYIFKEGEPCQKCNDKMLITAIYREVKDKEKSRTPF